MYTFERDARQGVRGIVLMKSMRLHLHLQATNGGMTPLASRAVQHSTGTSAVSTSPHAGWASIRPGHGSSQGRGIPCAQTAPRRRRKSTPVTTSHELPKTPTNQHGPLQQSTPGPRLSHRLPLQPVFDSSIAVALSPALLRHRRFRIPRRRHTPSSFPAAAPVLQSASNARLAKLHLLPARRALMEL